MTLRHTIKGRPICLLLLAIIASCDSPEDTQSAGLIDQVNADWLRSETYGPFMKVEFAMVYDSFHERAIAFGGRDSQFDNLNETWAFDWGIHAWLRLDPEGGPPWRSNHSMVYDPTRKKVLLFGGDDFTRSYNDLWEFDFEQNTWTELFPENPPDARHMHGMAYDTEQNVVIVFGGRRTDGGDSFDDTWEYNHTANAWRPLGPEHSPPTQDHVKMTYDASRARTILFVGSIDHSTENVGTWAYDYVANDWSKLDTKSSPTGDHGSFLYNPNAGKIILFGNSEESDVMETWMFDCATDDWTQLSATKQPSYREHFGMAYNDVHDVYLLAGGYPNNNNWLLWVKE